MRAPADGYTLLLIPESVTINATLYEKLNFNFIRDIVPIAMIGSLPLVMEVDPIGAGQDRPGIHRLRQSQTRAR